MTDVDNIVVGRPAAAGGVLVAPLGTAGPTDATSSITNTFDGAGYISEDGLTETADRSTEKIQAWGGDTVRVVQTEFSTTYEFTFLETMNTTVLKTVYGDDHVTKTPATQSSGTKHTVKIFSEALPSKAYVFDVKDGPAKIRIWVPRGQVIDVGETTYTDSEIAGYQVTVEAYPDDSIGGANAVKYMNDGITTQ